MQNLERVYIIGGLRTPIGKTGGALKSFLPEQLIAYLMNALLEKYKLASKYINELILGNCIGPGGNISRLSLLQAGWPPYVPATTIDFQCGSSLKSIEIAASLIQSGNRELVVVGGVESTSLQPNKQYHPKDPRFQGRDVFYKRAQFSPLSIGDPDMIEGAENVAERFAISRNEMDKETAVALIKLFPNANICEYYGASELGHVSYINAEEIIRGDSVGKAFPGVNFWIEDGVVWVKSPYLAPEFRPKATVGDLGKLDEQGNLYILGRKMDIINKGGIKLAPWEIEEVLLKHPQISQAMVFGIKHHIKGEQVAAVIVKKDPELTYEKVLAFCKNHLPHHACPQKIKFVESIP